MAIRYRDDDSSPSFLALTIGALAGFAVGIFVAQRYGGVSGISDRLRGTFGRARGLPYDGFAHAHSADVSDGDSEDAVAIADAGLTDEYEEDELDTAYDEELDAGLEERVLEAFQNDPVLCECAVDIGSLGDGIIELAGMVDTEAQALHAVTIARGVPDVETVVNRIVVGMDEARFTRNARRVAEGDPALTESRWEGQQMGTGKRRQGTSDDPDRHADPKPALEDRWLSADEAVANAAEDAGESGNRRGRRNARSARETGETGPRGSGAPRAPTGVPKGDHVVPGDSASREPPV